MKLFVTVAEAAADDALAAIQRITIDHDGIELRAEALGSVDLSRFRAATPKTLMMTWRGGGPISTAQIEAAIAAGADLVDVEWAADLDPASLAPYRDRIVLSHHDYDGMRDLENMVASMRAFG
jgi:3-dehydroquinate dehydratase